MLPCEQDILLQVLLAGLGEVLGQQAFSWSSNMKHISQIPVASQGNREICSPPRWDQYRSKSKHIKMSLHMVALELSPCGLGAKTQRRRLGWLRLWVEGRSEGFGSLAQGLHATEGLYHPSGLRSSQQTLQCSETRERF